MTESIWVKTDCPLCGSDNSYPYWKHEEDIYLPHISKDIGTLVQFVACKDCDMVYQNPRVSSELIDKFYSGPYRTGLPTEASCKVKLGDSSEIYDWIHACDEMPDKGRMLDVGGAECTLSHTFKEMGKHDGPAWDAYAIEPTKHYVDWARKNTKVNVECGILSKKTWKGLQDFPEYIKTNIQRCFWFLLRGKVQQG